MFKIHNSLRSTLLLSAATAAAVSLAGTASAQSSSSVETVVVTGSRIPQAGLYSISPVTTVSSTDLKLQGTTSVENMLNALPQVFAGQNSAVNNGGDGEATVDLRGLGATRTLVLIDGTRMMPGNPQDPVANLNDIPAALVDHIEVLTGGASATYGSDALGGVVNFIMRKDFEGVEFDGQYGFANADNGGQLFINAQNAKHYGNAPKDVTDGENADGTMIIGANAPNGKGNVTAYVSYHYQAAVYWRARDYSACVLGAHTSTYTCGGSSNLNRFFSLDAGIPSVSPYDFFESGSGAAGSGTFAPYGGQTFNYGALNYLQRPDSRYSGGFFAHYDVNKMFKFYSSFMFTDDHTVEEAAPSAVFLGSGTVSGAFQEINCTNPLMTAQENQMLCGTLNNSLAGQFGPNGVYGGGYDNYITTGPIVTALGHPYWDGAGNIYPGQSLLEIGRRNIEGGDRITELTSIAYRAQIGMKGDLDDHWSYDIYAQYGLSRYEESLTHELSKARVQNALEVDPLTGKCFSETTNPPGSSGCVPLDIFNGIGSITPAMLAYVGAKGVQNGYTQEQIVSGSVTGDLGEWGGQFPWAKDPVAVSFGGEFRDEELELTTSDSYALNDLYGAGGATPSQPLAGFHVAEGFFEIQAPIVQDMPYFENLTVDAGYRFSSYSSSGDTNAYKYGLEWQVIDDVKVRGSFQRAVRAPNVLELFSPINNILFSGDDPCAYTTAGQCATVPHAGTALLQCPASQCNYLVGGNTGLKPEESDTKSFGVVLTPTFLPGFSATIDYWDIKVNQFIGIVGPTTTLNYCYGSQATATTEAFFCPLVHRNVVGQIYGNGYVSAQNQNTGYLKTDGIDFHATYIADLSDLGVGEYGSVSTDFMGTYLMSYITEPLPGLGSYDCAGYYGPTCGTPNATWRHRMRVTWDTPWNLSLSLNWRYISSVTQDSNSPNPNLGGGPGTYTALDKTLRAYNWFDFAVVYDLDKFVQLRAGINNISGQDPPATDTNNSPLPYGNGNTFPGVYDYLGRTIFFNTTIKL